jgi:hypothetical protein
MIAKYTGNNTTDFMERLPVPQYDSSYIPAEN